MEQNQKSFELKFRTYAKGENEHGTEKLFGVPLVATITALRLMGRGHMSEWSKVIIMPTDRQQVASRDNGQAMTREFSVPMPYVMVASTSYSYCWRAHYHESNTSVWGRGWGFDFLIY